MKPISPIPAFVDNYIWQFNDGENAVVVDPGDAAPVLQFLEAEALTLHAILITHHHFDHIGGIVELCKHFPAARVYGPHNPAIEAITDRVSEGDTLELFGHRFKVLEIPGHTLDHIGYVHQAVDECQLFCGDTLFSSGCGRLFEGTPEQMYTSLNKLKALPDYAEIYCTHEYTTANVKFARAVEPNNTALIERDAEIKVLREQQKPTLPTTMALELQINPFLRSEEKTVMDAVGTSTPTQTFAALRAWKDRF